MKKNFFLLGLFAAVAITATLAIRKHLTHNQNQVAATAEVQLASETTTPTQTSEEEPAPVAQVQEDSATNVVEITFQPRFTFATSPSVNTTNGSK